MTFFAKRANGLDPQPVPPVDAVALPPGAGMADAMMRKMLGVGLSDLQGIAEQAGEMLAAFDRRLASIESLQTELAAQQTEILARLEYLAVRDRKPEIVIGARHDKS